MPEQAPITARGGGEPLAVQFSVFLANRVGQLKELLDTFARDRVEILGLSVVDSTDWAVIRIISSDPDRARNAMKNHPLPFTESDVLLAVLAGRDTLSRVTELLVRAELNLHFAYPLMLQSEGNPIMVLHVDDNAVATQILRRNGFALLGDDDLGRT